MVDRTSMAGRSVVVVGAGPAGLMAAERLAVRGHAITVYDRMTSPGRKFLMAGRGGLNLTHSEDIALFARRYGVSHGQLQTALQRFSPTDTVDWCHTLGIETFVGSSGRIFPRTMKASPLLRAWLAKLRGLGVTLALQHDWQGFDEAGSVVFHNASGARIAVQADATILAMGGASWPRLGSNGAWAAILSRDAIAISPLTASNSAVMIDWSPFLKDRFAGAPLKRIALTLNGVTVRGEALLSQTGLEGGAIYALSVQIREALAQSDKADLVLDLRPDLTAAQLATKLSAPRGRQSTATFLRKSLALAPVAIALIHEAGPLPLDAAGLAARIKSVALTVTATAGLDRAISTAGGVSFNAINADFMLQARPGVFVAGEMLDWDAPTGGYLLQATFATAVAAADGADRWLQQFHGVRDPAA